METNETKEVDYYQLLMDAVEALPPEAIEKAKKEVTRKGYDMTGYNHQYLVNVLNEVLGYNGWNTKYVELKASEGTWGNNKSYWEVTTEVTIYIHDTSRVHVGGHKAESYADALKGAITNGFKKTLSLYGVGKKAYEGTLDDDYRAGLDTGKPKMCATCKKKEVYEGGNDCTECYFIKNPK